MLNKKVKNAIRRDYLASPDRLKNQLKAHRKGKRTVITIPNPDPEETNKRFIKVTGDQYFRKEFLPPKKKETTDAVSEAV